jgi:hypothetical protein
MSALDTICLDKNHCIENSPFLSVQVTKNLGVLKPDGVLGLLPNSTFLDLMISQGLISQRVFSISINTLSGESELNFGGYDDYSNLG